MIYSGEQSVEPDQVLSLRISQTVVRQWEDCGSESVNWEYKLQFVN